MPPIRYVFGDVEPDAVCYVPTGTMERTAREAKQGHFYKDLGFLISWEDRKERVKVKAWDKFSAHRTVERMGALLEECHRKDIKAPSSYGTICRKLFPYPRVTFSWSAMFLGYFSGGWEQAFTRGKVAQRLYAYDMRSAYGSVMGRALPDPDTYRYVERMDGPGLYVVRGIPMAPRVPPPLRPGEVCEAALLAEEIDLYRLADVQVLAGVKWRLTSRWSDALLKIADSFPSARKHILATAWGPTASRWLEIEYRKPRRRTPKRWELPNLALNLPWAFYVVHSVYQKLFEVVDDAYHVFVDSVICDRVLPVGDAPGDWRSVDEFDRGLVFGGAGVYRRPGEAGYVKRAGTPRPREWERGELVI